ncbi:MULTISPECIES: GspH/FimT family pseudopilin [unclassified Motilimonas]|uniref:GspH/FimT family pseudopilin n=1 Tax=unclassified Motilimonas TaxID=2643697 RepID=UPI001E39D9A0|nr:MULTISPECIES: GspH/FimT family pseudopilin [unclassified Motilimonas]MCE0558648.1 GspH/FimT family pseudopilin [Motilimonas sp. E26]MDO6525678.1 GspH/FimT family pseudopilin [Motilimonas sp. 1_MG-2023]
MLKKSHGFTLVEVLTVIAIAGIMLMIAAPNFASLSADSRAFSAVNGIARDLMYARNQAVNNMTTVAVCPLAGGSACTSDWSKGVDVFIDTNENDKLDTGETLLKSGSAFHESDQVSFEQKSVRFGADGLTRNVSGSAIFYYCDDKESVKKGVVISSSGRAKVAEQGSISKCHS